MGHKTSRRPGWGRGHGYRYEGDPFPPRPWRLVWSPDGAGDGYGVEDDDGAEIIPVGGVSFARGRMLCAFAARHEEMLWDLLDLPP